MVECASLENWSSVTPNRGFESRPLRFGAAALPPGRDHAAGCGPRPYPRAGARPRHRPRTRAQPALCCHLACGRLITQLAILRRGAEHVVPERCADAVAAVVVLEVVAHVQLAQPAAERRFGPVVVHVIVQHVVAEVTG